MPAGVMTLWVSEERSLPEFRQKHRSPLSYILVGRLRWRKAGIINGHAYLTLRLPYSFFLSSLCPAAVMLRQSFIHAKASGQMAA